jgi:hypothetical protein
MKNEVLVILIIFSVTGTASTPFISELFGADSEDNTVILGGDVNSVSDVRTIDDDLRADSTTQESFIDTRRGLIRKQTLTNEVWLDIETNNTVWQERYTSKWRRGVILSHNGFSEKSPLDPTYGTWLLQNQSGQKVWETDPVQVIGYSDIEGKGTVIGEDKYGIMWRPGDIPLDGGRRWISFLDANGNEIFTHKFQGSPGGSTTSDYRMSMDDGIVAMHYNDSFRLWDFENRSFRYNSSRLGDFNYDWNVKAAGGLYANLSSDSNRGEWTIHNRDGEVVDVIPDTRMGTWNDSLVYTEGGDLYIRSQSNIRKIRTVQVSNWRIQRDRLIVERINQNGFEETVIVEDNRTERRIGWGLVGDDQTGRIGENTQSYGEVILRSSQESRIVQSDDLASSESWEIAGLYRDYLVLSSPPGAPSDSTKILEVDPGAPTDPVLTDEIYGEITLDIVGKRERLKHATISHNGGPEFTVYNKTQQVGDPFIVRSNDTEIVVVYDSPQSQGTITFELGDVEIEATQIYYSEENLYTNTLVGTENGAVLDKSN